jgi:hypothetical protein
MRFNRLLMILLPVLVLAGTAFSQTAPSLYAEYRQPGLQGDNSIANSYAGNYDLGVGYNFLNFSKFSVGAGFNAVNLKYNVDKLPFTTGKLDIYTPSLNISYTFPITRKLALIPRIGIGYAFYKAFSEESTISSVTFNDTLIQYRESNSGFVLRTEIWLAYSISPKLSIGALVGYDYYQSAPWNNSTYYQYDQATQILSPGVGIIYSFGDGIVAKGGRGGKNMGRAGACSPF